MGLLIQAIIWGFGSAYAILGWFGAPLWLRIVILISVAVWILCYLYDSKKHQRRTVSGEGGREDREHAGTAYLTEGEAAANYWRGASHKPRDEVDRLYPPHGGH